MDLNWFQGIIYGFVSGLMDILPVSAQAHRVLLLKLFGTRGSSDLHWCVHFISAAAAMWSVCPGHVSCPGFPSASGSVLWM